MRVFPLLISMCVLALGLIVAPAAAAQSTGGAGFDERPRTKSQARRRVAAQRRRSATDGLAYAPLEAPPEVHAAIAAANKIIGKPYKYGGGHAKVEDSRLRLLGHRLLRADRRPTSSRAARRSTPPASCAGASGARASGSPSTRTPVTPSS